MKKTVTGAIFLFGILGAALLMLNILFKTILVNSQVEFVSGLIAAASLSLMLMMGVTSLEKTK